MTYAATLEDVKAAADRIRPYAHVTPVHTCSTIDELCGKNLYFKCETFQKGGAFKFRGACNSIFSLSEEEAAKGVVTHSSGNHAGALALAAKLRGVKAHIAIPRGAPECKVEATKCYGGQVTMCEPTIEAREACCAAVMEATGAVFIHPYNYAPTIAGQGTIALEFLQQVPDLEAIIVPVSGGGMLSGIALTAKALKPGIKILAAEPTGTNNAADVAASKAAGELVPTPKPITIADGLEARLGDLTWPVVRDLVEGVITISEEEIVGAMRLCFERMKLVVEPSGAAGLAAAMSPSFRQNPAYAGWQRVGVVLCGGNADLASMGFWDMWRAESRKIF